MGTNKEKKKRILKEDIIKASKLYKEYFVGKTFMYVFEERYIQVTYRTKDFKHLTGIESELAAKDFYKNSINNNLKDNQIKNSKRYPYNLARKKVTALLNFQKLIRDDLLVLEEVITKTTSYKFGVTELKFTLCLINPVDRNKNIINEDYFVPQSLRVEDSVSRSKNLYEVDFIFVKKNDERLYKTMIYGDDCIDKLSIETKSMLDMKKIIG